MKIRFILGILGVFALAGCATTTQPKITPINQVQNQVVDLQQRMEEQEKEIVDLKYEVKEIAGKAEAAQEKPVTETSTLNAPTRAPVSSGADGEILKVAVAPSEVQRALKAAGFYEGKIDGKIGSRTRAAVVEFQKQHNLKADGVIGQKTWVELKSYLKD